MLFDEMSQRARNVASERMNNNMPLSFNDTICIALTASSKIYVGVSSTQMVNNMPMAYHAEVDLCNNLMNANDTAIAEIGLFNAATFQPVLPCSDCTARIIGMNPNNANTLLLLPTQNVALSQMGAYIQSQSQPNMAPMGQGMPMQNMGYQGMPMQNMGYQGMPAQNMGYQGMPAQNMGYQGMPAQNMGYQGMPAQNMGYQGMPSQYAASVQTAAPSQPAVQSQYVKDVSRTESMYLSGEDTDDGQILKNRLNKLFSVEDEPDINEIKAQKAQAKAEQKKKFKLF